MQRADSLFRAGQALLDAHKIHEACDAFAESLKIDPALGTLLNLADCHEQDGRPAAAYAEYARAIDLAAKRGEREREAFARDQATRLQVVVPRLAIALPPGLRGAIVRVDDKVVETAAPVVVEPGRHVVAVSATGKRARAIEVEAKSGVTDVRVAPLEDDVATPTPPASSPAPAVVPGDASPPRAGGASHTWGYVVGAAGVAAIGAGAYFGLQTFSKKSDSDAHCAGTLCDATGLALRDDAKTSATASDVAFGVGIGALAVGAWLIVTGSSARAAAALRVSRSGAALGMAW